MIKALSVLLVSLISAARPVLAAEPVAVDWLGGEPPAAATGVSWGVPWPRGAVKPGEGFTLRGPAGEMLPVQSWPLAYWPDGSLKWVGFATVSGPGKAGPFRLAPGAGQAPSGPVVRVRRSDTGVEVDTGVMRLRVTNWGGDLIESITVGGREVARGGRLVCVVQRGPEGEAEETPPRDKFLGRTTRVTVEQEGPVRAVLKIEGMHRAAAGSREWLPFVVRLYLYAGREQVRLVHTIIYDGDEQKDFVRGLGLEFSVPLREEMQNRHVRFAGEGADFGRSRCSRWWDAAGAS